MDYYAQPESSQTRRKRRKTGLTLMLLPFALTFGLTLWHSTAAYRQQEPDEFLQPLSWLGLGMHALFSPYMLLTVPVILAGLWLYTRPLSVCSAMYSAVAGVAYFLPALFALYLTLAMLL